VYSYCNQQRSLGVPYDLIVFFFFLIYQVYVNTISFLSCTRVRVHIF
jgi:hypothetical protein